MSAVPKPEPRSRRGAQTRAALIDGARAVFERDGFLDARIVDIAHEAGVATGSFYTYFNDKDEAFDAVLAAVREDMLHPQLEERPDADDVVAVVEAANRAYLEVYRRNARLMALREQVAAIDERFRERRRRSGEAVVARNARAIERLQREGKADPALDPQLAASAVSAMVSRMAYSAFVLGEEVEFELLVETLTRLWCNALSIARLST